VDGIRELEERHRKRDHFGVEGGVEEFLDLGEGGNEKEIGVFEEGFGVGIRD